MSDKSSKVSVRKLRSKLDECSKQEVIEFLVESFKMSKEVQTYMSIKINGDDGVQAIIEDYKKKIQAEFFPARGYGKLRVSVGKKTISDFEKAAKDTGLTLELMMCFAEVAVQYIHENGDIPEDMGDYFTDTYEEIIQQLDKEKTSKLYRQYKDRLKSIVDTTGCECWGIHDSLEGSYSMLKWADYDNENDEADFRDTISYAAMKKWLDTPEETRQRIIQNVWCGKCSMAVTIMDFSIQLDTCGIVLKGTCFNCGHKVARVIEKDN
ncbi:DUF6155 family protein [Aneurinibacillus tyrosinisolvens]|uniref:DUF6155 family protein n=1 Tax=Aneurinibacillus tyrosinisolvens TaxID=1443435 RepID=UPI00063F1519|nr:DUF6155 family protein [Aneurinibacillus tyrosinisolvens]